VTGSLCHSVTYSTLSLCCAVQVAERALFLWNNDYIVGLVAHNRATILPILFGPLERNARSHWNQVRHHRVHAYSDRAGEGCHSPYQGQKLLEQGAPPQGACVQ